MEQIVYKRLPSAKHNKNRIFQVTDRNGALYRSDGEFWVQQTADIPTGTAPVVASTSGGVAKNSGLGAIASAPSSLAMRGVIVFGDSRAAAETTNATNGVYTNNRGVFSISNAIADQRMVLVRNAGVGGNTLTQLLARYDTDVKPYADQAAWLVLWCDLNDIDGTKTLATMQAENEQLFAKAQADGLTVIEYLGYAPGTNAGWSAARVAQLLQYNAWRKRKQESRSGYIVIDAFSAVTDPASSPAATASANLTDGSGAAYHISVQGAAKIAPALAAIWTTFVPPKPSLVASVYDNYGANAANLNVFDFGLFQGAAGTKGTGAANETSLDPGFVAGVATGCTVKRNSGGGTAYCSTGPASNGIGNAQKIRIAGTTTASETYQCAITTPQPARAVAGAAYEAKCRVRIKNPVNLHACYMRTLITIDGVAYQSRALAESTPVIGGYPADITLTLRVPVTQLPAGASITVFEPQVLAIFTGSGGSADIYIEQMSFDRVA